ncbi:hypothetical protein B0J14DRAFT_351417 [Halenospora varia]|nr:hypothetical protein B0J14DRAFT_351417 [Halenospora varia]
MDINIETSPSELARVRRLSKVTGLLPTALFNPIPNPIPNPSTSNSSPQTLPNGDHNQDQNQVMDEAPVLPLLNDNLNEPETDIDLESLTPFEGLHPEEDDLILAFGGEYEEQHPFDRIELEAAYRSPLVDDIGELMLPGDKEKRELMRSRMDFLDSDLDVPYFDETITREDLDAEWVVRKGERKEGKFELRDKFEFKNAVRPEYVGTLEKRTTDLRMAPVSWHSHIRGGRLPTLRVRRESVENGRKVLGMWGTMKEDIAAGEGNFGEGVERGVGGEGAGVYLERSEKEIHGECIALLASGRIDYDTSYAKNLLEIHRGPHCLYCKSSKPPFGAFDREIGLEERERRKRRWEKEPEREMERRMADTKGGRVVVAGLRGLAREEVGDLVRIMR